MLIVRYENPPPAKRILDFHVPLLREEGSGILRWALAGFVREEGCEVLAEADSARADLAVVIGGDGTMLAAARNLVRHKVPVVGINQGRLGFMTDIALKDMRASIGAILALPSGRPEKRPAQANRFMTAPPVGMPKRAATRPASISGREISPPARDGTSDSATVLAV